MLQMSLFACYAILKPNKVVYKWLYWDGTTEYIDEDNAPNENVLRKLVQIRGKQYGLFEKVGNF